jgi:hypothetical protein
MMANTNRGLFRALGLDPTPTPTPKPKTGLASTIPGSAIMESLTPKGPNQMTPQNLNKMLAQLYPNDPRNKSASGKASVGKGTANPKSILDQISLTRSPWASMQQQAPGTPGANNPYLNSISGWLANMGTATQDADTGKYPLEYYQNYSELIPPTQSVMPDTYISQANRIADIYKATQEKGLGGGGGYGGGWGGGGGGGYKSKMPRWFIDMMYWRI